jgi:hypothetical protein
MEKSVKRLLTQADDTTYPLDDRAVSLRELLGLLKSDQSLITLECVDKVTGLLPTLECASELVIYFMASSASLPAETQEVCIKGIFALQSAVSMCGKVYQHTVSPGNRTLMRQFVMAGTTHTDLVFFNCLIL